MLSTTLYNLVNIVDQGLFKNLAVSLGTDADTVSLWWGVYSGYYNVLLKVPISISTALATSSVPALAAAFALKDRVQVKRKIGLSMRFIMVIAMPSAVGMMVLAKPMMQLLFSTENALSWHLLQAGAISIIFYSISTLSNAVLQGIDQMRIPIRNALIALAANVAAMFFAMTVLHMGIYAMVVANVVFSFVMCLLNGWSVKLYSGFFPQIVKTFVKPAIAAILMGVLVEAAYLVLHSVTKSNAISTLLSIVVGMVGYAVILLLVKGLTEEELKSFPKGGLLIRFGKKLHLL